MADAPNPYPTDAEPDAPMPPEAGPNPGSADPLVRNLEAVRDSKPDGDADEIAADDAGATAMAETLGRD